MGSQVLKMRDYPVIVKIRSGGFVMGWCEGFAEDAILLQEPLLIEHPRSKDEPMDFRFSLYDKFVKPKSMLIKFDIMYPVTYQSLAQLHKEQWQELMETV